MVLVGQCGASNASIQATTMLPYPRDRAGAQWCTIGAQFWGMVHGLGVTESV